MQEIEKAIGYEFKDKGLLEQALTPSFVDRDRNNQRLEFLGDSVLGLAISEFLYRYLPLAHEGVLTRIKSFLVSRKVLALIGREIGLDKVLPFRDGMNRDKLIADTTEAIIGAVYREAGLARTRDLILSLWEGVIKGISVYDLIDPKEQLQLYAQNVGAVFPEYVVLAQTGPSHKPVFKIGVYVNGRLLGIGEGRNKKSAERRAARMALKSNFGID